MLEATDMSLIHWWVDASFAVHPNFKSHTGGTILLGKGSNINFRKKQKVNTDISTAADLVGVSDVVHRMEWMDLFIQTQG